MDRVEIDEKWLQRKPIHGLAFLYNDSVRVLSGIHEGALGAVINVVEPDPDPVYTVELGSGSGDIQVAQSALVSATGRDTGTVLGELTRWYSANCDEEWEHQEGIKIDTLDNPGWSVRISLRNTELAAVPFPPKSDLTDAREWIVCKVEALEFLGFGGPHMLVPILEAFLAWAASNSKSAA